MITSSHFLLPLFSIIRKLTTSKISCARGQRVTPDGKSCVDRNECLDNPCKHGGICTNRDTINSEVPYVCRCQDGYMGTNCELMQKEQILRLSMGALAIILFCLLFILSTLGDKKHRITSIHIHNITHMCAISTSSFYILICMNISFSFDLILYRFISFH